MDPLLAAHPSRKGAFYDTTSNPNDRRHANTEFVAAYTGVVRATGLAVRSSLQQLARRTRARGHPFLPGIPDEGKETRSKFDLDCRVCAALPLQGHTAERLGVRRHDPCAKE